MSSVQKRCAEDEDDWDDFKKLAVLTSRVNWKVYSKESQHAQELYIRYKLTGANLINAVKLMLDLDALITLSRTEEAEFKLYQKLHAKYRVD